MKLSTDYKWRRLRRWVNELHRQEAAQARGRTMFQAKTYHETRRDVFKAVLLVMDAENQRAATTRRSNAR